MNGSISNSGTNVRLPKKPFFLFENLNYLGIDLQGFRNLGGLLENNK